MAAVVSHSLGKQLLKRLTSAPAQCQVKSRYQLLTSTKPQTISLKGLLSYP